MGEERIRVKPYGPLMVEHRLIEQVIGLIKLQIEKIDKTKSIEPSLIDDTAEFLRKYADRCHHGKEEDILFAALDEKGLSEEHKNILARLLDDHNTARQTVKALLSAKERYVHGDKKALAEMKSKLQKLSELYPPHIALEDKGFFIPVMGYFSDAEQSKMTADFWEFDRKLVHELFREKVEALKRKLQQP